MQTTTIPTATVKTWAGAMRYIADILDGDMLNSESGYTAVKLPRRSGRFGYNLLRNGQVVHVILVSPCTGIDY
jgi:hypothetical protein